VGNTFTEFFWFDWYYEIIKYASWTQMVTVQPAALETPEVEYWQECRRRAEELNIPAWQLAENEWHHGRLDKLNDNR